MKRFNRDGEGHRPPSSRDVAGGVQPRDVDSCGFELAGKDVCEGKSLASGESELQADFAEFLSEGGAQDGLPGPDPVFRERLRRQLWRQHVMTNLRDAGETH